MALAVNHAFLKLLEDTCVESMRAALILHWAGMNSVSTQLISRGETTRVFLDGGNQVEVTGLLDYLKTRAGAITLKDLEKAFEVFIQPEKRRAYGTVYTPDYIIDYLIRNALLLARDKRNAHPRLCDPFCGSAGFLLRAAEILEQEYKIGPLESFSELITGIDLDAWAIEHARCLLELYLAQRGIRLPFKGLRLFRLDSMLTGKDETLQSTDTPEGFDVLVTNPPYVRYQNLSPAYRLQLAEKYGQFASGNYSLALLFIVRGMDLLSQHGSLAMITPNNLFTSLAGRNVRQHLQDKRCIRRIVDFGHYKVFENASAYTCLIFTGAQPKPEFELARVSDMRGSGASVLQSIEFTKLPHAQLKAAKWRLASQKHLLNLEKIEQTGEPLGKIADIRVGFATLRDSVFLARACGADVLATSREGIAVPIEPECTRPAIKISTLRHADDTSRNGLRIIFPYEKKDGSYQLMEENDLKEKYPQAYAHLAAQRDLLEKRDKGKKGYPDWYAWGRWQGMEAPGPKLLTKTFSKSPQFYLDQSDQLFCNGYGIFLKPASALDAQLSIGALEKFLNSKVMHYYAKLTSYQIDGDYQCYQKNFIERFGIPRMSLAQQAQLAAAPRDGVDSFLADLYSIELQEIDEILSSRAMGDRKAAAI